MKTLTPEGSEHFRQLCLDNHAAWRVRFGTIMHAGYEKDMLVSALRALRKEGFLECAGGPYNKDDNFRILPAFRVKAKVA